MVVVEVEGFARTVSLPTALMLRLKARFLAADNAGNSSAAMTAMTAMTTSSSIRVKPRR